MHPAEETPTAVIVAVQLQADCGKPQLQLQGHGEAKDREQRIRTAIAIATLAAQQRLGQVVLGLQWAPPSRATANHQLAQWVPPHSAHL